MTADNIKAMQRRIGVTADGFWGPVSIAACQSHLRYLMPRPHPWPSSDQASLTAFYGAPGDEDKLMNLAVPYGIIYEGKPVKSIRCHALVSRSLERIVKELIARFPRIAGQYNGCYDNRLMRNGSLPSLHARGAAIDFDCNNNGLHTHWPARATMPLEVMEIFAREGWLSAGAFWSRDAMHAQATR